MKTLNLTVEELKLWCAGNDAYYWDADIEDNKVGLKSLKEGLEVAVYDFDKGTLTINDEEEEQPEVNTDFESDWLEDYIYDLDIDDEGNEFEVATWTFVPLIANAEGITNEAVLEEAGKRKYKIFLIQAPGFERFAVGADEIKVDDIYEDYANYLEGNAKVTEIK